jgi:hypothetical protein
MTGRAWALVVCGVVLSGAACFRRSTLPLALSDQEFWSLSESLSEPAGAFTLSDNLLSNEPHLAENVRRLPRGGGVYIGVGPEQNFSYIAGMRPAMAFIVDIRRENRSLHLFYKALFDLSADRAEFVSRLFSRRRPAGLDSSAGVEEIFRSYDALPRSPDLFAATRTLVRERLLTTRGLPLPQGDLEWIDRVFKAFYDAGPEIQFWGSSDVDAVQPTYRWLMTAKDMTGRSRSYLATEDGYRFVRNLQSKNLIVPVIGDFGGPSAIRRVGDYVRAHHDVVQVFYGSNVGVYLTNQQTRAYCASLATLPAAWQQTWFVERDGVRLLDSKLKDCSSKAK